MKELAYLAMTEHPRVFSLKDHTQPISSQSIKVSWINKSAHIVMGWIVLPPNVYVEAITSSTSECYYVVKSFKEVIKLKWDH